MSLGAEDRGSYPRTSLHCAQSSTGGPGPRSARRVWSPRSGRAGTWLSGPVGQRADGPGSLALSHTEDSASSWPSLPLARSLLGCPPSESRRRHVRKPRLCLRGEALGRSTGPLGSTQMLTVRMSQLGSESLPSTASGTELPAGVACAASGARAARAPPWAAAGP